MIRLVLGVGHPIRLPIFQGPGNRVESLAAVTRATAEIDGYELDSDTSPDDLTWDTQDGDGLDVLAIHLGSAPITVGTHSLRVTVWNPDFVGGVVICDALPVLVR